MSTMRKTRRISKTRSSEQRSRHSSSAKTLVCALFLTLHMAPSGSGMAASAAAAQSAESAQAQIRGALQRWTADFNAGQSDAVCGLFASDLISNYQGQPERNFDALCKLLHSSLADADRKYSYSLDIKEILVSGDLAVVRLVWTLKIENRSDPSRTETVIDRGLDVFRRQPDGSWKIARYLGYASSP